MPEPIILHGASSFDEDTRLTPQQVINEFFEWYTPATLSNDLLNLLFAALYSQEASNWNHLQRSHRIFLYQLLVKLVEAVYEIRKNFPLTAFKGSELTKV
jgi:hypothetical protein